MMERTNEKCAPIFLLSAFILHMLNPFSVNVVLTEHKTNIFIFQVFLLDDILLVIQTPKY